MTLYDIGLHTLDGSPTRLPKGKALLLVNVASKCGLTPQYTGLEELQKEYGNRGFSVIGFPCNQFGGQEPGTSREIAEFCSATYGVSFPMMEKVNVNPPQQHPLFAELNATADADGAAGDVVWNFEKYLVAPDGTVTRFRPGVKPEDEVLVKAIEAVLPE